MKKLFLISLTLLISCFLMADGVQPEGSGSNDNPYQIATLQNLLWLSTTPSSWNENFIQTAHINAITTIDWNNATGFSPIGTSTDEPFTGSYNGQSYAIAYLHIENVESNYHGLFGYASGAQLQNIVLQDIHIISGDYTAALVGSLADDSFVSNCSANGEVRGQNYVGGLIGNSTNSTIQSSSSRVNVRGIEYVGGFVGTNNSLISNCYSSGSSTGNYTSNAIGGFAGSNLVTDLQNCYSTGVVTGDTNVGGFVGESDVANINCFWDIETSGIVFSTGGIGKTTSEMQDVLTFTDTSTEGLSTPWDFVNDPGDDIESEDIWDINSSVNSGYPHLSWQNFNESLQAIFFIDYNNLSVHVGDVIDITQISEGDPISWEWDFDFDGIPDSYEELPILSYSEPGSYIISLMVSDGANVSSCLFGAGTTLQVYAQTGTEPTGSGATESPYQIANLDNLKWLNNNFEEWDKQYIQVANIDASDTENWNNGMGFSPLGTQHNSFSGSYDGQNYTIDGLYINRANPSLLVYNDYTGFIGFSHGGSVSNINLTNLDITGKDYTGGIIGYMFANNLIENCHVTGNVIGTHAVGGVFGSLPVGEVNHCSFSGSVTGSHYVGGLIGNYTGTPEVGEFYNVITIHNCITEGSVEGYLEVGGLIGNAMYAIVENCNTYTNVNGIYGEAGGIVGEASYSNFNQNFSMNDIQGISDLGGMVGRSMGNNFSNCFSRSDIEGIEYIGGLVGTSEMDTFTNCYSTGNIDGESYIGGLVGQNYSSNSINNSSFWDIETSEQTSSALGTGLTTAEMTNEQTFLDAGWDFDGETNNGTEDYWAIDSTINSGYPFLLAMIPVVSSEDDEVPELTSLNLKNYPNPFNPETSISFSTAGFKNIETANIEIFNIKGQKVNSLNVDLASDKNSEIKTVKWQGNDRNGNSVSSGVYFYKLVVNGNDEAMKKCLLLK